MEPIACAYRASWWGLSAAIEPPRGSSARLLAPWPLAAFAFDGFNDWIGSQPDRIAAVFRQIEFVDDKFRPHASPSRGNSTDCDVDRCAVFKRLIARDR